MRCFNLGAKAMQSNSDAYCAAQAEWHRYLRAKFNTDEKRRAMRMYKSAEVRLRAVLLGNGVSAANVAITLATLREWCIVERDRLGGSP
jgi:hypothetical protein